MLSTIRRYSMVKSGEKVLVAVSGGPDSVALLHALCSISDELGISLYVAHLNHSFRGEASDKDAEYVRELAASFGLSCTMEKIDVPEIQKTLRLSAEEAARLVRYEFLERVADEVGANRIALGHTADDQVETVLMNLLRGTGIDGLSGMPPVRGRIIRPLIAIRRSQVEEYIEEHGLHPRIDETNLLPEFTRNKIRLELLPLLRRDYNPDVDSAILRLAELASEETAYLNTEAERIFKNLETNRQDGAISLDAAGLAALDPAIRRRVMRSTVKAVRGVLADVGFAHIEELLRLLEAGSNFQYELPRGTFIRRSGRALTFTSSRPADLPITYCYEIAVPGHTEVPEIQAVIEAEVVAGPVEPKRSPDTMEAMLDRASITGTLKVRNWEHGDRIKPLGLGGSKKVQDVFMDRKIPREARSSIPLVEDDGKILWVAGLAVSELAKVTDSTQEAILLKVVPSESVGE